MNYGSWENADDADIGCVDGAVWIGHARGLALQEGLARCCYEARQALQVSGQTSARTGRSEIDEDRTRNGRQEMVVHDTAQPLDSY